MLPVAPDIPVSFELIVRNARLPERSGHSQPNRARADDAQFSCAIGHIAYLTE
jgi:hypothetical protein